MYRNCRMRSVLYTFVVFDTEISSQKPQCGHIKAISGQDKQKFKNTDVSGTVNCNCDHIMIGAAVDMVGGGER